MVSVEEERGMTEDRKLICTRGAVALVTLLLPFLSSEHHGNLLTFYFLAGPTADSSTGASQQLRAFFSQLFIWLSQIRFFEADGSGSISLNRIIL